MGKIIKKYAIRVVGALCILGALLLMFMGSWVKIKDVDKRGIRNFRDEMKDIFTAVEESYSQQLNDKQFKDEAKDCDLPATNGKAKSGIREVESLVSNLMDDTVSFGELWSISWTVPGIAKDTENLLNSDCANDLFTGMAYNLWGREYEEAYDYDYGKVMKMARQDGRQFEQMAEDLVDNYDGISVPVLLLKVVMSAIILLGVASAATHICNKARGLKYVFMVLLVLLVVGTIVGLSMTSDLVAELAGDMDAFADMTLSITVVPFFAIALMVVPIVLDIAFERKKETI